MSTSIDRIASGTMWMAKLLVEEPDALMRARPGLWEPWEGNDPGPPGPRAANEIGPFQQQWSSVCPWPFQVSHAQLHRACATSEILAPSKTSKVCGTGAGNRGLGRPVRSGY